ncbi:hypothetical protein RvY_05692 [Ramazzottius varieornatus]|uniref:HOOK N-terminal domain-containing protein n=1 Tax=Ramazzottius varieornatus TaxID=947166 RepID=A0A1D1UYX6_RAMVA|nr:hypothetical protein RvY_05692 [Ramazzottius varieornatus]
MDEEHIGEFDAEEHRDELYTWFQTLDLPTHAQSILDLISGNALAEALLHLDQAYFSGIEDWIAENRFAVNDLQERMVEYIETKHSSATEEARRAKSGFNERFQADLDENSFNAVVGRLLQLVLVCAVLCPNKEEYINRMRDLPSSVAVVISRAILQLLPVQRHSDDVVLQQHNHALTNGDTWCANCSTLDTEVNQLVSERKKLLDETAQLRTRLDAIMDVNNESSPLNKRVESLQKEANAAKEALSRMETSRDEYRVKCNELQSQLGAAMIDSEQLKRKLADMDDLKDELDEWKQTVTQLRKYETEAKLYKKKIDEMGDLRSQIKLVEARNVELMKQNLELKQENEALASLQNDLGDQTVALETRDEELKLSVRRYENAEMEISELRRQVAELSRRNKGMEVEKHGVTNGGLDDAHVQEVPLQQSLSFELEPESFKEEILRRDIEIAKLSQKLTDQDKQLQELTKAQADRLLIPAPVQDSSKVSMLSGSPDTAADSSTSQRDAQVQSLQKELDDLKRLYTHQQKLMTAAWYRTTLKLEQQSFASRLANVSSAGRPTSFLEEQRRATNPPVVSSLRTQNSAQAAPSRTNSRSFLR